jgi:hypothetical protein
MNLWNRRAARAEAIADMRAIAMLERALLPLAAWLDAHPGRDVNEYDGWRNPALKRPDATAATAGGNK